MVFHRGSLELSQWCSLNFIFVGMMILSEQGLLLNNSDPGASHMYPHDLSGSMPVQKGTGVGCLFFLHKRSAVQLYSYPSTFTIGNKLQTTSAKPMNRWVDGVVLPPLKFVDKFTNSCIRIVSRNKSIRNITHSRHRYPFSCMLGSMHYDPRTSMASAVNH